MKLKKIIFIITVVLTNSCISQKDMIKNKSINDIDNATLIVMAYPEEVVKSTKALYSKLLPIFGLGIQGYIRAGHACLVVVKDGSDTFEYFDFGRYISPNGYARARGANTDPETNVDIKVKWENGKISNIEELLEWLYDSPEKTRGYGDLYASICEDVNYERVKTYVNIIQDHGVMKYGPFVEKGSNCSRFVTDAMFNGILDRDILKRVGKLYNFTPPVLSNVDAANSYDYYYVATKDSVYTSDRSLKTVQREIMADWGKGYDHIKDNTVGTEIEPVDKKLEKSWQWLGGIGYGAWFDIVSTPDENVFSVKQYNVDGELMFSGNFKSEFDINLNEDYQFDYPSHFKQITLKIDSKKVVLNKINSKL